jgi:hypothetical protein
LATFGRFWLLFKLYLAPSCAGTCQPCLNRVYFLCAPHDLEALKDLIVVKGT